MMIADGFFVKDRVRYNVKSNLIITKYSSNQCCPTNWWDNCFTSYHRNSVYSSPTLDWATTFCFQGYVRQRNNIVDHLSIVDTTQSVPEYMITCVFHLSSYNTPRSREFLMYHKIWNNTFQWSSHRDYINRFATLTAKVI